MTPALLGAPHVVEELTARMPERFHAHLLAYTQGKAEDPVRLLIELVRTRTSLVLPLLDGSQTAPSVVLRAMGGVLERDEIEGYRAVFAAHFASSEKSGGLD
jgi:hypothetical protein